LFLGRSQKQGLHTQTAAATVLASTGGNQNRGVSFKRQQRRRAPPPGATKRGTFHSDGHGDSARLHRGPQKQGIFTETAAATARVSTGGNQNRDFHTGGSGDSARLHWGQQKQGLSTLTAAATARASTGGNKNKDFSLRRPRRQRASPPGATKAGAFHSDGRGDGSRLHRSSAAALLNPIQSFTRLLRRRGCPRPLAACCAPVYKVPINSRNEGLK